MVKAPKVEPFRNRIIEYGVKPASEFLAHPKNARLHPQFQRDAMKAALDTVGFVAPVLEAKSGYLVDGHERIWQALKNNDAPVPFVRLDIDEDEESYILATFDPLTGLANYDTTQLEALLQEVNSDSPAIQAMLSQLAESANLYGGESDGAPGENGFEYQEKYGLLVECASTAEQEELFNRLSAEGLKVKVLVV